MRLPRTLFGRLVLILFACLALAQALTFGVVLAERGMAMRGTMVSYLAADVASSAAMLDRLSAGERRAWLPRLERPHYRLVLGAAGEPAEHIRGDAATPLARSVSAALAQALGQPVTLIEAPGPGVDMRLGLRLSDGTALAVDVAQPRLRLSPWLLAALAAQLALLAGGCWLAVRQATRPLAQLAEAARALEPGRPVPALPHAGPREVADAADAFDRMRLRIAEHLEERSQMLGAIAHDLQTPITRMRLRAELLDDAALRDKLHADLGQMQHLVEQGLAYARSAHAVQEPEAPTELTALLHSAAADYQDAGQPVRWLGGPEAVIVHTRPRALRRIVGNLIDNALKFGGAAELGLAVREGRAVILVRDRGPGIPADQLDKVLQPFYRIDASRNPATGGTGLGLAIVQRLAPHCHARLRLLPREGGGLVAELAFDA
ncbi:ATP-binding protein [Piscinibacter sp.]|uniref:ATP-binding protein n=1 Tax=Piscinibacter sp. TaxID=1903157 RepID=UPI0039E4E756